MNTLQAIFNRKSTRAYTSTPIPEESLKLILKAGMAAPVANANYDSLHLTGTAALEEDAQILKVIEAYCTSASFPQGHGSSRFPQPLSLMSDVSSLLLTASWKKSKATQMGCRVWKAGDLQQRSGYKAASFR